MQDVVILQSETKIEAALGKNVKVSLPKAFQTNKTQNKSLAMKGVPTDIKDEEFREFLDLNKINYAKADCLKSKKDARVLPIFQLEINDPIEVEALISQNLVCDITGIGERIQLPKFRPLCENCRSKQKCLICGESHTKDARIRKLGNLSVLIVKGRMLRLIKGVLNTKNRHLGSMW